MPYMVACKSRLNFSRVIEFVTVVYAPGIDLFCRVQKNRSVC